MRLQIQHKRFTICNDKACSQWQYAFVLRIEARNQEELFHPNQPQHYFLNY